MDTDKIGQFIKELRSKNNMSQYDLAERIPIDRSVVSKWERGEVLPPIDKMKILCDIFGVSVDELITGEMKTKENEKEHQKKLFDYLIKQDYEYKKVKLFSLFSVIIIFILIFSFLIYYFLETHNTEKIYRIYGKSDNYEINNGILVITREKSYLKIGSINNEIHDIILYYKDNNEDKVIYEGNSDIVLLDGNGYNAYINCENIEDLNKNLYIKINDEDIKLNLSKEYHNDNYILDNWDEVSKTDGETNGIHEVDIDKIKKEFKCDETICTKVLKDNAILVYNIEENVMYINGITDQAKFQINYDKYTYESDNTKFEIENNKLNCTFGNCTNYEEIYDKYYNGIIKKYLK